MVSTYQRLKQRRDAGEIDGFTLIELLIVIVVLGILAAVVIFALGGVTGKSQLAACQADGATVSTAMAAFHANNPGAAAGSTKLTTTSGTEGAGTGSSYIQSWPSAQSYLFSLAAHTGIAAGVLSVAPATNGALTTGKAYIKYIGPASCGPSAGTVVGIGL